MPGNINPTREQFAAFRPSGRDGPIQMLNPQAAYPDGRAATGQDAHRTYAQASAPVFHRAGGRQVWVGRFEHVLIGPADERWEAVFIAEYPNAGAFAAMLRDLDYLEAVRHRQAAVEHSRLIRLAPASAGAGFGQAWP